MSDGQTPQEAKLSEETMALASNYRRPGEIPVEDMWEVIQGQLPERAEDTAVIPLRRRSPVIAALGWAVAASAVLAVGVGIGRVAPTGGLAGPEVAIQANSPVDADGRSVGWQLASQEIDAVEPLLSLVASDARTDRFDPEVGVWAERVLLRTRVLLTSSGADPELHTLLEDLELILIQIANLEDLEADRGREELALIAHGLEQNNLIGRLRAVADMGP